LISTRSLIDSTARDFRRCWKSLALTDVAYKIIAYVALTPLVGLLFCSLIEFSGNSVITDQDILFFFFGPVGWLILIAVGAPTLAIAAIGQSALLGILATEEQRPIGLLGALRFASASMWPVIQVTARLIALSLLTLAPFLVVAGIVYFALLTEHDINFYLKEKPPVFLAALGIGGVIAVAFLTVLLRLFTGWFFALPLVLFADVSPSNALRVSRERATGHRVVLLLWIAGWFLATILLSALATAGVAGFGHFVVPRATSSLELLAVVIAATLFLWAAVNLAVSLLSATTFAAILFNLYRQFGSEGNIDASRLDVANTTETGGGFQLTRTRLAVTVLVGFVVATAIGISAIQSVHLEDNVEITGHRGSSKAAPENTVAAIKQAIEDGTDWVEIDVQETADGAVVVFHDSDFMKVAGVGSKIWDVTLTEAKAIDIGSWFAPEFSGERVPTLGEVLDLCKGKTRVNIELKYYGHDERLEQRVVEIVDGRDMASEIVIMSLKMDAVKKMKSIRPNWKVGLLMSVAAGNLKNINADFLAVNASFADRRFIRSAHNLGRDVHVWTVNDAPTMSMLIGRGVDNLITDKPALARTVLRERAKMSAPERLLLELAGALGAVPEMGEP
jgi:glycerophosphoryl diester phosphodiesterase